MLPSGECLPCETVFEYFVFCCCDHASPFRSCCDSYDTAELKRACPVGSWVSTAPASYVRNHRREAIFSIGQSLTTMRQLYDCEHDAEWSTFRRQLNELTFEEATLDSSVLQQALQLVNKFNISSHPLGRNKRAAQLINQWRHIHEEFLHGGPVALVNEMFCTFGYISASAILGFSTRNRAVFEDAMWLFRQRWLDMSSSSSWPIGYWDLALNMKRRLVTQTGPHAPRKTYEQQFVPFRVSSYLAAGHLAPRVLPFELPLQDIEAKRCIPESQTKIRVAFYLDHPGHDMEIPSSLLRVFAERIELVMIYGGESSQYMGGQTAERRGTMRDQVCTGFPKACEEPHKQLHIKDAPWHPVDLLVCNWHNHCQFMEHWAVSRLPLISFYGGSPWNDYGVRMGTRTPAETLIGFLDYVKRGNEVLLMAGSLIEAEIVHAYIGVELPVYRPLCSYVGVKYAPRPGSKLLLLNSSSSSGLVKSGWAEKLLQIFAGFDLENTFHSQDGFMSFSDMATFRGAAWYPAPHVYSSVQFKELYNMNIPLLAPDLHDFALFAGDSWDRIMTELARLPNEDWRPPAAHWKLRHPFPPLLPEADPPSAHYTQATLYWAQWSEIFHWPHVQHFHGIPHFLELAHMLPFERISWKMAEVNRGEARQSKMFWQGVLPTLLHLD
eukprot:TRINITY_DN4131_c0_g2_i1.p1 TRINITY_DN4131_c0_g2~~TRINITY_DN4131_c0_g2_i1.p1  ORF type:complete len:665 (+),score=68.64 TRINITY_DN4131_c0_g2_i1:97-2091(+)